MEKKSFVLHYDSLSVIEELTDEQVGKLLRKMKSYHNGNNYNCNDKVVDIVFIPFKNQFDRDKEKFGNVCQRNREIANKRRNKPKVPKSTKSTTGKSDNQIVPKSTRNAESDNDSDKDNDNDIKLSKDNATHGNNNINKIIEIISEHNDGIIDGTIKEQRQYSKLLFDKLGKSRIVMGGKYDVFALLNELLKIIKTDQYFITKISGPKKIYYSLSELMNRAKSNFIEKKSCVADLSAYDIPKND